MTKVTLIGILLGSALALTSIKSNAALLVSDDTIDLAGTTAVMQPDLAGPVIYDELIYDSVSPSGNDIFQVGINIQNRVSRSDTDGNLIFAPRHLDYPDEVFEFNFAGIAVPINMPVHVPEPALLTLFLTCFAGFVMFKRH